MISSSDPNASTRDAPDVAVPPMPDPDLVTAAASRGVRRALAIHKALGVPVATWRDGRVVVIPAAELPALAGTSDAAEQG